MKVLVATRQGQGEVPGDYSWTVDGELVTPVTLECCSPGTCGCGRGFVGLASSKATTTAIVVDRPELDRDVLWDALHDSLERQGWVGGIEVDDDEGDHRQDDEHDDAQLIEEHLACIEYVCSSFPTGTVVSRWGSKVYSRHAMAA